MNEASKDRTALVIVWIVFIWALIELGIPVFFLILHVLGLY